MPASVSFWMVMKTSLTWSAALARSCAFFFGAAFDRARFFDHAGFRRNARPRFGRAGDGGQGDRDAERGDQQRQGGRRDVAGAGQTARRTEILSCRPSIVVSLTRPVPSPAAPSRLKSVAKVSPTM